LKDTFPGEVIDVRADGDSLSLIVRASSQPVADRALALVAPLVKAVVNNLQVVPPGADTQIVLRVKFAEVNRSVVTSFGVNLLSTGALNTPFRTSTQQFNSGNPSQLQGQIPGHLGGTSTTFSLTDVLNIFAFRPDLNLGAIIQDLQTQGLLQILAEPNLVTTNGKEASFLVGGEFPIPVLQGGSSNAVTIQFREFGIRLNFLPQVTAHHTIKLHVKPEISTIDLANGVVFSGFTIPALATRRMETDIELGEGQTFLIGGLLDDRVTESLAKVPGLSHIPILGALFKSRSENKSKTELLVMVTPETTYPYSASDAKPLPRMPKEFLSDAPSRGHADKNTPPAPDSTKPAKEIAPSPGQAGAH
jgi:pilus assembly protein CpaC